MENGYEKSQECEDILFSAYFAPNKEVPQKKQRSGGVSATMKRIQPEPQTANMKKFVGWVQTWIYYFGWCERH